MVLLILAKWLTVMGTTIEYHMTQAMVPIFLHGKPIANVKKTI